MNIAKSRRYNERGHRSSDAKNLYVYIDLRIYRYYVLITTMKWIEYPGCEKTPVTSEDGDWFASLYRILVWVLLR